jgi:branched-chain amino acid transport system substrate-binding protein
MQRTSGLWRALATGGFLAIVVTSFSLAACGSSSTSTGTSVDKHIKIGTLLAVSGGDASSQLPAEYAVNLAVSQNATLANGYTLSVSNTDYEGQSGADPTIAQAKFTALQADSEVMAIVGPFNSGAAKLVIPVANNGGGPTLISPTNTNAGLTLSQFAQVSGVNFTQLHPSGKPDYYFRIPANDVLQGKAGAAIALTAAPGKPAAHTAFVVDDNTTYGKPLADFFTQFFTAGGGQTVGTRTSITSDTLSTLPQLATAVKASRADIVYYGGVTAQGGCKLKKALVAAGYTNAMVGADGIATDPGCIADAGPASVGMIGTVCAPDPSTLTGSAVTTLKQQYATFTQGLANNTFTPYSAQSYDAAMIEITAIKGLISAGSPVTRSAIRDAIANIQYTGVIGNISFDANGDNAGAKILSVYAVLPTAPTTWTYETTITY